MRLWGLDCGLSQMAPVALRTKKDVIEWAAQRYMGANEYRTLRTHSDKWKVILSNHPAFRIVRVRVTEELAT